MTWGFLANLYCADHLDPNLYFMAAFRSDLTTSADAADRSDLVVSL
jgi:hypothetical protein